MTGDFGWAIRQVKAGKKIQRAGWNGKNMYVFLDEGGTVGAGRAYAPCLVMYTAHGVCQPGWLASQADMLADDWSVVA